MRAERRVGDGQVMIAELVLPQVVHQVGEPQAQLVWILAIELDQEDGGRIAVEEVAEPVRFGIEASAVEHVLVHDFNSRGMMPKDQGGRCQSLEQTGELDDQRAARIREFHDPEFRLHRDAERPLRAYEQSGQVERAGTLRSIRAHNSRRDKSVEVIPAHAPEDPGKTTADLLGVLRGQALCGTVAPTFESLSSATGLEFRARERCEFDHTAVGQNNLQTDHMIDRLPIEDRSGTRGVIRDHAADRRAIRRRDVGARAVDAAGAPGSARRARSPARLEPNAPRD